MNNADVTVYDLQKWLSPLWKGNTVYAETAFILKNALGENGMSAYTLAVTYEHEPDDYYAVTAGKSGKFPRTLEKLKNGQNIKIALYGGTEFFPFRSLFTNNGREPRRRFSRRKNFAAVFKSY